MRQTYKAQLASTTAYGSQHDPGHLRCYGSSIRVCWRERYKKHTQGRQRREQEDSDGVWYGVDEVGCA